jgi:hypothetical protein
MAQTIRFSLEELMAAHDAQCGFCISCGHEQDGCEPGARGYTCDECGLNMVYGAEECVVMGLVKGGEDDE